MTLAIAFLFVAAPAFPPLPEGFSSFGAAVCDGYAYVYGGHASKTHTYATETTLGKFRRISLANPKAWEELPGGVACQGLALVHCNGKLYRIGGMRPRNAPGEKVDNVSLASVQVFDVKAGTWSPVPDLPEPRSSFDAIAVGNTIVVIGGWNMKGLGKEIVWAETALMLDTSKNPMKWESIPQPFKRRALNIAALDGKVYVVGGMTDSDEIEKTVNVFEPASRTWSEAPELPGIKRNGFSPAACVEAGRLYASPADGMIYRLNGKDWEKAGTVESPRIVHRILGTGDGRLIILGGANRTENVALVEAVRIK